MILKVIEDDVIDKVRMEMENYEDKDSINKLYRQARIWVRFHCYYANCCTPEESRELNLRLKNIRFECLKNLEG